MRPWRDQLLISQWEGHLLWTCCGPNEQSINTVTPEPNRSSCCPWQTKGCYGEERNPKNSEEERVTPPLNCSRACQQDVAERPAASLRTNKTLLDPWW